MLKKSICVLFLVVAVTSVQAQDMSFDDFKKKQQAEFGQFKQNTQAEFDAFRRQVNDEYAEFMKNAWEDRSIEKPVEPAPVKEIPPVVLKEDPQPAPKAEPKPAEPVKNEPVKPTPAPAPKEAPAPAPQPAPEERPAPQPIAVKPEVVVVPAPQPAPAPVAPVVVKQEEPTQKVSTSLYGTMISVNFPKDDNFHLAALSNQKLSDAWKTLSAEKYDVVVNNVLSLRDKLKLCDWAYLRMIQSVCEKHYGKSNEATYMLTYLMTQSGYKVRMAQSKSQGKLYMLFASMYDLYSYPYLRLDDQKFYILDGQGIKDLTSSKDFCVCKAKYAKERAFSMQIKEEQRLSMVETPARKLTSKRGLSATVSVNKNGIDFYNSYPRAYLNGDVTTSWVAYANTPLDKSTRDVLYPLLKKNIQSLSERDAVGLILNWVQTAFVYEYDDKVWGGDRPFFPSETLYYPYCDCEDRAILFSRIIRDVMGLDVVLLYYPGHLAAAVGLTGEVKGDYVTYKGRQYTVCDPTYINANVGMSMPDLRGKTAKVVVLK